MTPSDTGHSLPAKTSMGRVRLQIADLERALSFYTGLLGLSIIDRRQGRASLTADPLTNTELIILEEQPGARPKPRGTTGLYHFALLTPNRRELARLLKRLLEADWPFQGFSDHGVSEALYLADPDGNGIELYADRTRSRWPMRDGKIAMYSRPLDLENLIAELDGAPENENEPPIHPQTCVGHMHLHVSDLARAEAFYSQLIGFDVTERNYPGALFMSAGGYHHHLGVNTWAGPGAQPPPPNSVGLLDFAIRIPHQTTAQAAVDRLRNAGMDVKTANSNNWLVQDPDGTGVLISTDTGT